MKFSYIVGHFYFFFSSLVRKGHVSYCHHFPSIRVSTSLSQGHVTILLSHGFHYLIFILEKWIKPNFVLSVIWTFFLQN